MEKIIATFIVIILILPFAVSAHEDHDQSELLKFREQAGVLPGEIGYPFDRVGEWIEVNLLTLSTKKKQQKKLAYADERVAELVTLIEIVPGTAKSLRKASERYESVLRSARDMAEKIIFLDGAEIALAEKFEETSRTHERIFANLLGGQSLQVRAIVSEVLIVARNENRSAFEFMVTNYQFTDIDIQKHQRILQEHIEFLEDEKFRFEENAKSELDTFISEAREFQDAGLNIQSYERIEKAKNFLYSRL